MMRDEEELVANFLAAGPNHASEGALDATLARVRPMAQRPGWLVRLGGGTMDTQASALLRFAPLIAVVAALGIIAGAFVAGGMRPSPQPTPVAGPSAAPTTPTTTASPSPEAALRLVAYHVTERLQPGQGDCPARAFSPCSVTTTWLANQDGGDAHPVMDEDVLGWSADGSRLLLASGSDLVLMDAGGSELQRLPVRDECKSSPCGIAEATRLCALPCVGTDGFALSPDGTRVAFVRAYPDDANSNNASVITIVDLASGVVSELQSTRTTNGSERCWEDPSCQGQDDTPRWSPDGRQIVFARQVISPGPGDTWTGAAVFLVDADGGNLRRVTPEGLNAIDASWSPDGNRLTFTGSEYVVNADHTTVTDIRPDVYVVNVDGSGLRRLTSDGDSGRPAWTDAGRITFARALVTEPWIMDPDGSNQAPLGDTLAELTAAGCTRCIYPTGSEAGVPAIWQP